ncbi:MAG: hypothetical protein AB1346_00885 [Thermodesulfobacteriota bacterium]
MRTDGTVPAWIFGLLLFAGIAFAALPAAGADCGCPGMKGQDNTAAPGGPMHGHGAMHGQGHGHAHGGHMGDHPQGMRETLGKLRALEAKMEASKGSDDGAFRSASLEHAKLLGDLLENHLKHMEGMHR